MSVVRRLLDEKCEAADLEHHPFDCRGADARDLAGAEHRGIEFGCRDRVPAAQVDVIEPVTAWHPTPNYIADLTSPPFARGGGSDEPRSLTSALFAQTFAVSTVAEMQQAPTWEVFPLCRKHQTTDA